MTPLIKIIVIFIGGWFAISVAAVVLENLFLWIYLKRSGAKILFIMAGTPGYLGKVYKNWCKENGVSPEPRLRLRRILWINVLLATTTYFLVIASVFEKP